VARLPERIGKYDILRVLGKGGMGTVYLGRDADLDRSVAIKVLRNPLSDEELLQRFLREARASANLRHENIITIYEVGQHDRQPFMAMEYVDGPSLGQVITARDPLPLGRRLAYLEQICAGLHHAHREGIVHRDIKPPNLMVDRGNVIRIVDFGIARVEGSGMTMDGTLIGSLNYMSPEQMLGRTVDLRSDIFAVGAVAYELLSYQQAFPGSLDDGLLHRLPNEHPAALSSLCADLPEDIERIVMRALAKNPADRFADVEQMRIAVREARRGVDPGQRIESLVPPTLLRPADAKSTPPPSSSARRPATQTTIVITGGQMAAAAALLAAAGVAGVVWIGSGGRESTVQSSRPAAAIAVATPASPPAATVVPAPVAAPVRAPVASPPVVNTPVAERETLRPGATASAPPIVPAATAPNRSAAERAPVEVPPPPAASSVVAPVAPPAPVAPIATPQPTVEPEAPRVNATAAAPVAAPPAPLERERPGILQTLTRYQDAYRERNVKSLVAVYPGLPRESRQALERAFGRDCRDYDVTFGNLQLALNAEDPTYATVTVRSVYTCQPKTAQAAQPQAVQDVFVLRKLGDGWLIDSIGTMDAGRR
jgi:serine/threonine-protein kinase